MTIQKQRQVVNTIIQYFTCGKPNIEEERGGPDNCLEFLLPWASYSNRNSNEIL